MKYNFKTPTAILNESGIATTAGWITVYNAEPRQREYCGVTLEYLAEGIGLPARGYTDKPELPADNQAIVRSADNLCWEIVPDYRGQTVYSTETGQPETVTVIGELPDNLTLLAPATIYDQWDGSSWVTDSDAQHAAAVAAAESKKQSLINEALASVSAIQLKLQSGRELTDSEKSQLDTTLDYIDTVSAIDVLAAPNINWSGVSDVA